MLADILHNIADHTDTLLRVLREAQLDPEFVQRLENHILLEEKENARKLESLSPVSPQGSDPLVKKLKDHSYFIQRMIEDRTIPRDLKEELLDHFTEEHQEWQVLTGPGSHDHDSMTAAMKQPDEAVDATSGATDESGHAPQESDSGHDHGDSHTTASEAERNWTVGPMWLEGGL